MLADQDWRGQIHPAMLYVEQLVHVCTYMCAHRALMSDVNSKV